MGQSAICCPRLAPSVTDGGAVSGAGAAVAPKPGVIQTACLAPGWGPSSTPELMTALQAARAPSMLVAATGSVSANLGEGGGDPVLCGTRLVLSFLQSLLESYMAAISSRHRFVNGLAMSCQSLVNCLLREHRSPSKFCSWNLRVVLNALTELRTCPVGAPSMFSLGR